MKDSLLRISNITKNISVGRSIFNQKKIERLLYKNITFELKRGEILGIIGLNGAGKTSLLRTIASITQADSGDIFFRDQNIKNSVNLQSKIKLVNTSEQSLFQRLTIQENLHFFSDIGNSDKNFKKKRIPEVINLLKLNNIKNIKVYRLSQGQKRLAAIAKSLLVLPEILLFDEATASLDIRTKKNLIDIVKKTLVIKNNLSVIWVTHNTDELESLCDKVMLIHDGEIKANALVKDVNYEELLTKIENI